MKGQLAIFGLFKHEESIGFHSRSDETFTFLIFRSKYILTVVATAWYFSLLVNCEQPSKKSGILFSVTTIFQYLQAQLITSITPNAVFFFQSCFI